MVRKTTYPGWAGEHVPVYAIAEWVYCPNSLIWKLWDVKTLKNPCIRVMAGRLVNKKLVEDVNANLIDKVGRKIVICELELESDELMITGKLDYAVFEKEKAYPVELKVHPPPKTGEPWLNHAVTVVAYALLLSEYLDTKIEHGYVYYSAGKHPR